MRYHLKPAFVDAVQWDGTKEDGSRIAAWVTQHGGRTTFDAHRPAVEPAGGYHGRPARLARLIIQPPTDGTGVLFVRATDWIISEPGLTRVTDQVFTATFDPTPPAHLQVINRLAAEIEQLVAVVNREINCDANEGAAPEDPHWQEALRKVCDHAQATLEVLDDPAVLTFRPEGRSTPRPFNGGNKVIGP